MRHATLLLLVAACSTQEGRHEPKPDTSDATDTDPDTDDSDTHDTGQKPVEGCRATPQPADRVRSVVLSLPYDVQGRASSAWAVLGLSEAGQLSDTGQRIEMGRATMGEVVYTPDAEVGIAVQEDGSLGVFTLDGSGVATVVQASYKADFYAGQVVVEPSGEGAWIVDGNWAENGGGLYHVAIDCEDGTLSGPEKVLSSKLGFGLHPFWGLPDRAFYAARAVDGVEEGDSWLLEWGPKPVPLLSMDAFSDEEAIVSDVAVTYDDAFALIGDNSMFSGVPNRVAVVGLSASGMSQVQTLEIEDPMSILTSPFHDMAIVASGYGDAYFILDYDPHAQPPFSLRGEMDYAGASPQLPGSASMLDRGSLTGFALVAEVEGLRSLHMRGKGHIDDLGVFTVGSGYASIPGAVGVQP